MIDALIKRVSVTYKCYEMYAHRCNCSCFEIDQEMDAILLIIGIVYTGFAGSSLNQYNISRGYACVAVKIEVQIRAIFL
jgi:hypothetical protein